MQDALELSARRLPPGTIINSDRLPTEKGQEWITYPGPTYKEKLTKEQRRAFRRIRARKKWIIA